MAKGAAAPRAEENEIGHVVMARKEGQQINIGNGLVVITVKQARGGRATYLIEAPKGLSVVRGELIEPAPAVARAS